ncbi:putative reverse transcriptase domain-containing protein, partial [Tanacetum coccineum]
DKNGNGIHVDPSKIEDVKNWKALRTPTEVRLFLRLNGYYRSVMYTDHKSLQHIFSQKEVNMRQRRWIELFSDYDYENSHTISLVKMANVVPDTQSIGGPGMKKDIPEYVSYVLACPNGISVDFVLKDYKMDRLARLYLNEIVARHGVPISIISYRDSRLTSRFWQSMQEALGTHLDMSTTNHPQTDGQSEHTIQTLEDIVRAKCRSNSIMWAEVIEGSVEIQKRGPEIQRGNDEDSDENEVPLL